jgi:AmmeMemoRadiSam system protein A
MIPDVDRQALLGVARSAIGSSLGQDARVTGGGGGDTLNQPAAAFVTLHSHGELRGCIGHVEANRPLRDVVASCAVSAAKADPRFAPVTADELASLDIEISVLSGFEPVHSIDEIEVGRHGLLIESGWRRGLLLPQVAPEWNWDAAQFVAQTCRKAGLPPDAWPARGATLYRFEAEVFGERREPR